MRGITKRFPGVLANDNVNFTVEKGEIHALLGENGAGKSTLMNMVNGLYRADEGQILLDGKPVKFSSPRDAIDNGVGMVHQHFMLVPTQTVAENLILGQKTPRFYINYKKLEQDIADLSQKFGLAVEPHAKIWQLSVGEQQRVEILKMLYQGAKLLIMDEPTAVLTPQEVTDLFKTLREMTATGHTIIFISHKLDEVVAIADRVTVLRRGRVESTVDGKSTSKAELARLMVGREVLFRIQKKPAEPTADALVIDSVSCENDRGLPALRNMSLTVRSGEVVGIAGVAGNGQTELAQVITGLRQATSGKVTVQGQDVTNQPATATIDQGLAYIPADRNGVGSSPNLNLADNLILKSYRRPPIGSGWRIDLGLVRSQAEQLIEQFDVKTPSVDLPARLLSGGNLQKLILAREISRQPKVVIAVYPVRGLDVGAIESIHQMLIDERDRGAGILLISEDLDELLSLSDRIVVLFEGQIVGEVPPEDERIDEIGLMMAGTKVEQSHAT
ncbi:MAG: ABC transporter ATP-binding protein [Anaerolineae bacterium]|nr:ABC transporter ATP-binding protein [Anaerolineae bacterium]MCB0178785.1 ABC transporter ATP-binding protein [Anaerolineae bacterium]MCB9104319.1 ABC transporter ATP-binding protein [Anaerolineales bacterium]